MTDQRNARPDPSDAERTEALPTELQPLHNRLLADGEHWRAGLPSPDGFARRARIRPQAHAAAPIPRAPTVQPEWRHMTRGPLPMNPGRLRGLAGGAMAIAVVALFALLLRGLATSRGSSGTSTGNGPGATTITPRTPAPTATGSAWRNYDGLSYSTNAFANDNLPAIAPTDPRTVYIATLNPAQVRRTTDSGATWTTLPLPGDSSNAIAIQAFVSPLNARTVFLAITLPLPGTANPSQCPTMASVAGHGGVLASGVIPCTHEYYSQDGGAHWHGLTLPNPSVIEDPTPFYFSPMNHVLRAQGQQLFALTGCGPSCMGQGTDLVTSGDGGVTWHLADSGIRQVGQSVCDFVPSPTGGDVYAITAQQACSDMTFPTEWLWHSADAGAHWTQVSQLSSPAAFGMVAVPRNAGQPLLYIHMPPTTVQGRGASTEFGPTNLHVSEDGGRTWKAAPAAGVSSGMSPGLPMGVLSDGTVLESFTIAANANGTGVLQSTLYGWKLGDAAWHQVAPGLKTQVLSLVVADDASGQTLWATTLLGEDSQTYTGTIGVESYRV